MLFVRKLLSLASTTLAGQNGFARHDRLYYHVCELKNCTIRGSHEVPYIGCLTCTSRLSLELAHEIVLTVLSGSGPMYCLDFQTMHIHILIGWIADD